MNDRLYRSRTDRMLAGVAGGLADRFELDPAVVRVAWAILVILSGGIFLLIYIVMAIVVPEEASGAGSAAGWSGSGWSGSGWTPAGSTGWSTSWPAADAGAPQPAAPGPPAPAPAAPPPDPAVNPTPGSGTAVDPTVAGSPPPSAPGFAAPIAGSWAPAAPATAGWPADSAGSSRHAAREARRAARRAARGYGSDRSGAGGIVAGLILVALGAYFLVRTFVPELDIDRYWPAGLIVIGLILVILSIRRTPGDTAP